MVSETTAYPGGVQTWPLTESLPDKVGEVTTDLFGFLTAEPPAEVDAVHPRTILIILTTEDEMEAWVGAPGLEASFDGALKFLAKSERITGWLMAPFILKPECDKVGT
jgi:putative SOS response-associated peptidase YedK